MGNQYSKAESLNAQGVLGSSDYTKKGKDSYLNLAIKLLRQSVEKAPLDHPQLGKFHQDLGYWLSCRYELTESDEDSEEALRNLEESVRLAASKRDPLISRLIALGDHLKHRYEIEKTPDDLERAGKAFYRALKIAPQNHENRPACLVSLAEFLVIKYKATSEKELFHEAVRYCQQALKLLGRDQMDLARQIQNTCQLLKYETVLMSYELEKEWANATLSSCKLAQYEVTKEADDLESAIKISRLCLDKLSPAGFRVTCLINLSKCLAFKYSTTEALENIDEAISIIEEAVDEARDSHRTNLLVASLDILGDQLLAKYRKTEATEDLKNLVVHHLGIIVKTPQGHRIRASSMCRLSLLLDYRYSVVAEEKKDLDEAIEYGQRALKVLKPNAPNRSLLLDRLSSCFAKRFGKLHEQKDLLEAISFAEAALEGLSDGDPRKEGITKKIEELKVRGFGDEIEKKPDLALLS